MNLYCIKYLKITNNSTIVEIQHHIFEEIKLYRDCIDCSFKTFETTEEKEVNYIITY